MNSENNRKPITLLFASILWGIMTVGWYFIWDRNFSEIIIRPFGYKGNWLVVAVYGMILYIFSSIYGAYRIGYFKQGDVIFSNCLAATLTNGITYLQTCLVGRAIMDMRPFIALTLADFLVIWVWSKAVGNLYLKLNPPHKMLFIYGGNLSAESLIYKMNFRAEKYDICEAIDVEKGLEAVFTRINLYTAVVICDVKSDVRNKILKYCYSKSIRVYFTPKISDTLISSANKIHLFDTPLYLCRNQGLTFEQKIFKRILDVGLACIGFIVTSPLMLLSALVIKLYDKGPVLYKQKRLTLDGKTFEVYKFRSMIVDAEKKSGACLASENDSRITPVGRFLRKTRLDELPQILNILKGDMSLVGPRPERPEISKEYIKTMPEFDYRLKVKAGLTGYAQVLGKYNTTPYDKLKLDLMYIENYSILLDIKLILMTIKILFMKSSTEGIAEGSKTASLHTNRKDDSFLNISENDSEDNIAEVTFRKYN